MPYREQVTFSPTLSEEKIRSWGGPDINAKGVDTPHVRQNLSQKYVENFFENQPTNRKMELVKHLLANGDFGLDHAAAEKAARELTSNEEKLGALKEAFNSPGLIALAVQNSKGHYLFGRARTNFALEVARNPQVAANILYAELKNHQLYRGGGLEQVFERARQREVTAMPAQPQAQPAEPQPEVRQGQQEIPTIESFAGGAGHPISINFYPTITQTNAPAEPHIGGHWPSKQDDYRQKAPQQDNNILRFDSGVLVPERENRLRSYGKFANALGAAYAAHGLDPMLAQKYAQTVRGAALRSQSQVAFVSWMARHLRKAGVQNDMLGHTRLGRPVKLSPEERTRLALLTKVYAQGKKS